ncbi:hypothetical protein ACFZB9_20680 [Kitasatospora sp. NPDC008050]|uniref:hypothetical protein n=1 Tax=Kitasatospora sp. NPDC008050 TaxID=3364021 RepID=UPI0036E7E55A
MKTHRACAAVLLAAAALTLTACGPDETTASTTPATSAAGGASVAATPTAAVTPSPKASSGSSGSSAKPSSPARASSTKPAGGTGGASPTANCTANAAGDRVVEATDDGYLTHVWMRAKATKFVCGPDVPDDGYFESYGNPTVFTFSNDVKTTVLADMKPKTVDLDTFMKLVDNCLHNPSAVQAPDSCYGNQYSITANSQNVITSIGQQYHP